jgi:hypothetical protein
MHATPPKPGGGLITTTGLSCKPGNLHIDWTGAVDRAVVT